MTLAAQDPHDQIHDELTRLPVLVAHREDLPITMVQNAT